MSALHRSWLADEARRTIVAPEMRPVGQVSCVPTSTGVLIGCAYRRPMAPPQSVIHQIIQEDDLLAADRARNVNKAERAIEREAESVLDLQIKHQNLPGALV